MSGDADALERFRARTANWFAEHGRPYRDEDLAALPVADALALERNWLRTLNNVGFGAPHVPRAWGGGGFSQREQAVVYEEWARAEAPLVPTFAVSRYHVPSTFLLAGTDAQRERYIRGAIDGEVWCQGFSEPSSGSDLASLRTSARRDGDSFVVNGEKVWSSFAHLARWCLLLARTDPDAPRHRGISYFVLDMRAPGVEVRPIRQAAGRSEFNQIFLDGVRIPAENLIGAENNGWAVAQQTLAAERGPLVVQMIERVAARVRALAREVDADGGGDGVSPDRDTVAALGARAWALHSLALDSIDTLEAGVELSDASSVIKVGTSELDRKVTDLRSLRAGPDAGLEAPEHIHHNIGGEVLGHPFLDFLDSWAATIAGGTNEVQRTIIAERTLSMPRPGRS